EGQPLHPARGDEALGLEDLEVQAYAEAAAKPTGTRGIRDQVKPPHDDRHLGFERLCRRGLEKAERSVAAVDAVTGGPAAAAADHRLDHGDVAPARLRVGQRERDHAALTAAGRRNVLA